MTDYPSEEFREWEYSRTERTPGDGWSLKDALRIFEIEPKELDNSNVLDLGSGPIEAGADQKGSDIKNCKVFCVNPEYTSNQDLIHTAQVLRQGADNQRSVAAIGQ